MIGAEAVLFINNNQREVFEDNRFLNERMGADDDGNFSVRYPLEKLGAGYRCCLITGDFGWEFVTAGAGNESDVNGVHFKKFDE